MNLMSKLKGKYFGKKVEEHVAVISGNYAAIVTTLLAQSPKFARALAETAVEHQVEIANIIEIAKPIIESLGKKLDEQEAEFVKANKACGKLATGMQREMAALVKLVTS